MVVQATVVRALPAKFAPEAFATELIAWVRFGEAPDNDLLHAILRNDLQAVIGLTGNDQSWAAVRATMIWLWNFAPKECWGSEDAVRAWRDLGATWWRRVD